MNIDTIRDILGLAADASDEAVLTKIADLQAAAGEQAEAEHPTMRLLRLGQHEQVSMHGGGCIVTLLEPLVVGKTTLTITELGFRRPKLKDIRRSSKQSGDVETMVEMIAALTGQTPKVLDELSPEDFKVCNMVCGFLSRPLPRTGASS